MRFLTSVILLATMTVSVSAAKYWYPIKKAGLWSVSGYVTPNGQTCTARTSYINYAPKGSKRPFERRIVEHVISLEMLPLHEGKEPLVYVLVKDKDFLREHNSTSGPVVTTFFRGDKTLVVHDEWRKDANGSMAVFYPEDPAKYLKAFGIAERMQINFFKNKQPDTRNFAGSSLSVHNGSVVLGYLGRCTEKYINKYVRTD